jgi:hypothetical protein
VHSILYDSDDPSLFISPSAETHKLYALALLQSKRFQQLSELVKAVFGWPRWADGDWRIMNAEIARATGGSGDIPALVEGMDQEIPAQISLALVAIGNNDADAAEQLALQVTDRADADGYSHPEGRPAALAHAILCQSPIGVANYSWLVKAGARQYDAIHHAFSRAPSMSTRWRI